MADNSPNSGSQQATIETGKTPGPLFWSLIAGFLAFALDLGTSYPLQQHACATQHFFLLRLVSLCAFVVAVSGFAFGWLYYRSLPHDSKEEGPTPDDRAHFQSLLGMAFSLAFALAILAIALPRWILTPCD